MPSDDTHIRLAAEDDWTETNPCCPVCDEPFDDDEWPLEGHGGDAWGGTAIHSCPTEDCGGTASVSY